MSEPPEIRDLPKPIDVANALEEALEKLSIIGGDCALIGGVALGFYGIERFTKDVDLAVTVAQSNKALQRLTDSDPRPRRVGGVSIATPSGVRVDFIDRRVQFRALFEEVISEATKRGPRARAGRAEVPVVPLHYLIALKLVAERPQDEVDLGLLLAKPELDYKRAREVVDRHLGPYAARRLDRLARTAKRADAPADYDEEGYGDPDPT